MKKNVLMYFDLVTSLKTTEEVGDLSLELDTLSGSLFKSQKMTFEKALEEVSETTARQIKEIFSKNGLDINDKEVARNFLETLSDLIKKFKVIQLTLSFTPSQRTIEKIHEFVSENIGVGFILDIQKDESIVGGAVVIYEGKYNDFTLKKALDETFANKRKEILQIVG